MAQQVLNVGTAANDGTGDPLRSAMQKVNANFTELYATAGSPSQVVDVRAVYNAYFDGGSHPMSSRYGTLAAAQAAYPNAGVTSLTDQIDWAALQQACYAAVNGSGAVLQLSPGARVRLNRTVDMLDISKVWIRGGPNVYVLAQDMGTLPSFIIRSSGPWSGTMCNEPLRDIQFLALGTEFNMNMSTGGVAGTGYRVGSKALKIVNTYATRITGCRFNGYDQPIEWGDLMWCIFFDTCAFTDGNYGLYWPKTTPGWITAERMLFTRCDFDNNNYGMYIQSMNTNNENTGSGWVVRDCSIDYNIIKHIHYDCAVSGGTMGGSFILSGGHMETNTQASGNTTSRIYSNGDFHFVGANIFEMDILSPPPAYVDIGPQGRGTANSTHFYIDQSLPIFRCTTALNEIPVSGSNNSLSQRVAPYLYKGTNGSIMQADLGWPKIFYTDGVDRGTPLYYQNVQVLMTENTAMTVTVSPDSTFNHITYTELNFMAYGTGITTFTAGSGVFIESPGKTGAITFGGALGRRARLHKVAANYWVVTGDII